METTTNESNSPSTTKLSKKEALCAYEMKPIGRVSWSWFKTKNGTPRQPSICSDSKAVINLGADMAQNFPKVSNVSHILENLSEFSHVWLIFVFHKSLGKDQAEFTKAKVAPPRLDGKRVGLLSTRSPHRPNLVGLTLARLESVEGTRIHVSGIDLIEDTPVLDIKPYIPNYDSPGIAAEDVKIPSWICDEKKSVKVNFTSAALGSLKFKDQDELDQVKRSIVRILSEDPRSVYRKEKCSDKLYFFTVDSYHVTCWFDGDDDSVQVLKVKRQPEPV